MDTLLESNKRKLLECCEKGLRGDFVLPVREVSFPLTNVCNNYCIMCHACNKDYNNHTYNNEPPYFMTLKQYKKIVTTPNRKFLDCLLRRKKNSDENIEFVFGTAETFLNPNLYEICKYTKEIYPNSKIRLISNGTIPPKGDIVKYIDRVGFSIDGCTAETFEKLRPPAKFDHVVECMRKWDKAADEYNKDFSFGFGTVVSSANLHELSGIVILASSFKHIDSVYVQPIILHKTKQHLDYLLLKHVSDEEKTTVIENLKRVSQETGVRIDGLDSIAPAHDAESPAKDVDYAKSYLCRYAWNGILSYTETGTFRYFCCYMDSEKMQELLKKYPVNPKKSLEDMYNSYVFWQFRKDMIDGKLIDYCNGCSFAETGYRALEEKTVDLEERIYL